MTWSTGESSLADTGSGPLAPRRDDCEPAAAELRQIRDIYISSPDILSGSVIRVAVPGVAKPWGLGSVGLSTVLLL
jgi:hypothetical protein